MSRNNVKKLLTYLLLLPIEIAAVLVAGILSDDDVLKICVSAAGIVFNLLVCVQNRIGFVIGAAYAIGYAVMSYMETVYASAVFMAFVQFPSAILSFVTWNKKSAAENGLIKLSATGVLLTVMASALFTGIITVILTLLNSSGALFDAFFFSMSIVACYLLAKRYRAAYITIFLSGIGGTALWIYQFAVTGQGLSVLIVNAFVTINAALGIFRQYRKTLPTIPDTNEGDKMK